METNPNILYHSVKLKSRKQHCHMILCPLDEELECVWSDFWPWLSLNHHSVWLFYIYGTLGFALSVSSCHTDASSFSSPCPLDHCEPCSVWATSENGIQKAHIPIPADFLCIKCATHRFTVTTKLHKNYMWYLQKTG